MDAVSDARFERVIMMTAAQVGKTEILLNTIGYFIHKEPSPILLMQPTLEMGESFSKDRLATMLRDCTCLHGRVKDPRARDSGNTLLHKTFPGGHITIAGANSPASLASRPIRILLCDEVDRYPVSAGTEGDPVSLAIKRTQNFWNRRIVLVSTPTHMKSRIVEEYEDSSKEEWTLPCPNCGHYNALSWERLIYENRTQPVMVCSECGHEGSESDWKAGNLLGKWQAGNFSKVKGFHVNAFASPWVTWPGIVEDYHRHYNGGPEMLKVWQNTVLGLPYEAKTGAIEIGLMDAHKETYTAEIPDEVILLTAGIDTQDNRVEVEIVGHGLNNETWGIEYRRIYGDPSGHEIWSELDRLLSRSWHYEDGAELNISCACIDSSGHYTDEVYAFCKGKERRKIFPIVGRGVMGRPSVTRPTKPGKNGVWLFILGVSTIKADLYSRLQVDRGMNGYCHFPDDESRGYNKTYYAGLLSERMVIRRKNGQEYIMWETLGPHTRNEPLDCRVYALGAFKILNPDMTRHYKERFGSEPEIEPETPPVSKSKPKRRIYRRGMRL